jgi:hypothetical protein
MGSRGPRASISAKTEAATKVTGVRAGLSTGATAVHYHGAHPQHGYSNKGTEPGTVSGQWVSRRIYCTIEATCHCFSSRSIDKCSGTEAEGEREHGLSANHDPCPARRFNSNVSSSLLYKHQLDLDLQVLDTPLFHCNTQLKSSDPPQQAINTMRFASAATALLAAAVVRAEDEASNSVPEVETSSSVSIAKPTFTVSISSYLQCCQ